MLKQNIAYLPLVATLIILSCILYYRIEKPFDLGTSSTNHPELIPSLDKIAENILTLTERIEQIEKGQQISEHKIAEMKAKLTSIQDGTAQKKAGTQLNDESLAAEAIDSDKPKLSVEEIQSAEAQRFDKLDYLANNPNSFDPEWTPQVRAEIESMFEQVDGLEIVSKKEIVCSGEICKITMQLPPGTSVLDENVAAWTLYTGLGKSLPSSTSKFKTNDDGSKTVTHYFARRGFKMPQVEDSK